MKSSLQISETALLCVLLALLALGIFGPALAQPVHAHVFADQRMWLGIPCALDVLSNLPFALWGVAGLLAVTRVPALAIQGAQRSMATLFFAGLVVTAAASSWYHLRPDDAGLVMDRLGMVLPFAGLLGLAVADRVSERAGVATGLAIMLLGPLSVAVWAATGNVLPWAVVQFGGMLLVCALALRRPCGAALGVRLGVVISIYALAKLLELGDQPIHELTGGIISGHSLKHLVAAFAAWPLISALNLARGAGHNRTRSVDKVFPGTQVPGQA
ncbi:MAG: hypothetical protein H7346_05200 [Burkholderiaceae bacterium]|nr:hypothetical protein [Burkholderiaceae bacterium]